MSASHLLYTTVWIKSMSARNGLLIRPRAHVSSKYVYTKTISISVAKLFDMQIGIFCFVMNMLVV